MNKKQTVCMPVLLVSVLLCTAACAAHTSNNQTNRDKSAFLLIGSWNVQALFDGEDTGKEYAEFREDAAWTEAKYRARLTGIAEAVKSLRFSDDAESGKPDVLALLEVENSAVCEELAAMLDYGWTFFAAAPSAPLGLAVMSRFPLISAVTHSVQFGENRGPRPIAELVLDADGEELALMVCHWKSKLGGEKKTEQTRRAEAAVIARRLLERGSGKTPVIIMGDLNENHDEFFRNGSSVCALMPDTGEAAAAVQDGRKAKSPRPGFQDFLVLSEKKPPVSEYFEGLNGAAVLYSPWPETEKQGSYYYKDQWETIDHVFLNGAMFDGSGWNFAGFRAAAEAPFINGKGLPAAYVPRTGGGLSDHLPLLVRLERRIAE